MPSSTFGPTLRHVLVTQNKELLKAWAGALNVEAGAFQRLMEKAVSDWENKPDFNVQLALTTKTAIQSGVSVDNEHAPKWFWIDKGTGKDGPRKQSYVILPKTLDKPLAFQTGYSPRTAPIAKSGVGNGKSSGPYVKTYIVIHPGITARKFVETWADERRSTFIDNVKKASKVAIRKANTKL